jgi:predicted metal-dependent hydrolase
MDQFLAIFLIAIIIFISYIYYESKFSDVSYTKSDIDNKEYLVRNLPDNVQAANTIALICKRLLKLKNHLQEKYPNNTITKRIVKKLNLKNISEGAYDVKYTSYSINKGEKIVLCLRSRTEPNVNKLEPINILMFVTLHEVAHIGTESIGHTNEFWNTFKFILKESIDINIYKHHDFEKDPKEYCGTTITDSPL